MTEPPDQYLHAAKLEIDLDGADFEAIVHLALVNGRTVCVGIDLHAFELRSIDEDGTMQIADPDEWTELTARRLRQLQLGELTETARQDMVEWLDTAHEAGGVGWTPEYYQWLTRTKALYEKPGHEAKVGRPAHLPDELVAKVVAGAYNQHVRKGGNSPVLAVREGLQRALESGELADTKFVAGDGVRGEVTIHQARALVRRARKLDLLEDAPRSRGKRKENEG